MKFNAVVSARSSKEQAGPPGEAEVLRLNPQRLSTLLAHTRWDRLIEGTLNLEVDESVVIELGMASPAVRESGDTVRYPAGYSHIPRKRGTYLYFDAILSHKGKSEAILIRTAEHPLKRRIEAFAPVQLRASLHLSDGDEVSCEIQHLNVEQVAPGNAGWRESCRRSTMEFVAESPAGNGTGTRGGAA